MGINSGRKLKDIPVGEAFKIGDYDFVVLEQSNDTAAVILKELLCERPRFGKNNNFRNSNIDKICKKFGREIKKKIGRKNLIKHEVDLTTDGGLKDYKKIKRKMSILTDALYIRYAKVLREHEVKWYGWWLATAHSTPKFKNKESVVAIGRDGTPIWTYCTERAFLGVRPFCILNSDIFVSQEE